MDSNSRRCTLLHKLRQSQILAKQKLRNENVKKRNTNEDQISDHGSFDSLDLFPNEIMHQILSMVEGTAFLRCRLVSRRWNALINDIIKAESQIFCGKSRSSSNRWRTICTQAVSSNVILEAVEQKISWQILSFPFEGIAGLTFEIPELSKAEWHSICKLVQTGCLDTSVRKEETRTSLNFQFQDDITMAVVSKNLVVMSHASGKVSLWALDSALMMDVIQLSAPCTAASVALGDVFRNGPYDLGRNCASSHHLFVSGTATGHVVARGLAFADYENGYLPLSQKITLLTSGCSVTNVSFIGDLLFVASTQEITTFLITLSEGSKKNPACLPGFVPHRVLSPPTATIMQASIWPCQLNWRYGGANVTCLLPTGSSLFAPSDVDSWTGSWDARPSLVRPFESAGDFQNPNRITLIQNAGFHNAFSLSMIVCSSAEEELIFGHSRKNRLSPCHLATLPFRSIVRQTFVFHDDLFVALTYGNMLLISANGLHFRCYNTLRAFGSHVTAVAYHTGLLLLGTDNGQVFAFKANQTLNFMALDLFAPTWCETVLRGRPVQSLHLSHDQDRVSLAVAFVDQVHLISWTI